MIFSSKYKIKYKINSIVVRSKSFMYCILQRIIIQVLADLQLINNKTNHRCMRQRWTSSQNQKEVLYIKI